MLTHFSKILLFVAGLALSWCLSGCATIQNSQYASFKDGDGHVHSFEEQTIKGLSVSYERDNDLSDENFDVVQFTFENQSKEWIRLKDVSLDMGSPEENKQVFVPNGNDLKAWAEAAQQRKAIEDHNEQVFLAAIAGTAVIAGATSHNASGQIAGLGVAGAALSIDAIQQTHRELKDLNYAPQFPDTHLLSGEIAIPPGLFQKRWIVLNTKIPLKHLFMKSIYNNSMATVFEFEFRQ
jgi:hypothetical protein